MFDREDIFSRNAAVKSRDLAWSILCALSYFRISLLSQHSAEMKYEPFLSCEPTDTKPRFDVSSGTAAKETLSSARCQFPFAGPFPKEHHAYCLEDTRERRTVAMARTACGLFHIVFVSGAASEREPPEPTRQEPAWRRPLLHLLGTLDTRELRRLRGRARSGVAGVPHTLARCAGGGCGHRPVPRYGECLCGHQCRRSVLRTVSTRSLLHVALALFSNDRLSLRVPARRQLLLNLPVAGVVAGLLGATSRTPPPRPALSGRPRLSAHCPPPPLLLLPRRAPLGRGAADSRKRVAQRRLAPAGPRAFLGGGRAAGLSRLPHGRCARRAREADLSRRRAARRAFARARPGSISDSRPLPPGVFAAENPGYVFVVTPAEAGAQTEQGGGAGASSAAEEGRDGGGRGAEDSSGAGPPSSCGAAGNCGWGAEAATQQGEEASGRGERVVCCSKPVAVHPPQVVSPRGADAGGGRTQTCDGWMRRGRDSCAGAGGGACCTPTAAVWGLWPWQLLVQPSKRSHTFAVGDTT